MSDWLARFSVLQRILHWLMAVMVLTMLFSGVTMVLTVGPAYLTLVDIHKPYVDGPLLARCWSVF
jgi:cytochrome b561